jgi:hypothetical protein
MAWNSLIIVELKHQFGSPARTMNIYSRAGMVGVAFVVLCFGANLVRGNGILVQSAALSISGAWSGGVWDSEFEPLTGSGTFSETSSGASITAVLDDPFFPPYESGIFANGALSSFNMELIAGASSAYELGGYTAISAMATTLFKTVNSSLALNLDSYLSPDAYEQNYGLFVGLTDKTSGTSLFELERLSGPGDALEGLRSQTLNFLVDTSHIYELVVSGHVRISAGDLPESAWVAIRAGSEPVPDDFPTIGLFCIALLGLSWAGLLHNRVQKSRVFGVNTTTG